MTGSTFGGAARLAAAKDGKSAITESTKMSRVIAASAYKRSYNVILSEAKNLGSFLGRYLIEIDQRCFAEPVLSKAEGLNMTASLARGVRLLDKTKIKAEPKQDKMDDRAPPANFGRQDKVGAEERHGNIGEIEIK
jgi:hypothetical protein